MLTAVIWLALPAALIFFWAIGAYNRLVRLRSAVVRAYATLDDALVRQLVWMRGTLPESVLDAEGTQPADLESQAMMAWWRLQASSEQFTATLNQVRAQPIDVPAMASLVMAHEAMRAAWSRVLADALEADAVPSPERLNARWLRLLHQSLPLRAAFNEAALAYNHAIAQFPASLIARLAGFRPAGTVSRLAEGR